MWALALAALHGSAWSASGYVVGPAGLEGRLRPELQPDSPLRPAHLADATARGDAVGEERRSALETGGAQIAKAVTRVRARWPFTSTGANYQEGWDHTTMGFVTDYFVSVAALIVVVRVHKAEYGPSGSPAYQFKFFQIGYAVTMALGMLFGGIAHQIMDGYYAQEGGLIGKTWGAPNSSWMPLWVPAVFFLLASSGVLMVGIFGFAAEARHSRRQLLIGGPIAATYLALALYALIVMLSNDPYDALQAVADAPSDGKWTGKIAGPYRWGTAELCAPLLALLGSVLCGAYAVRRHREMQLMPFGCLMVAVGHVVLLASSGTACSDPQKLDQCTFPKDFNHNCIFHVCLFAGVVLIGSPLPTVEFEEDANPTTEKLPPS